MTVAENWTWRSAANRCLRCGWLFSCRAEQEDRKRCLACESKRPMPKPRKRRTLALPIMNRHEDKLLDALKNVARMQQAEGKDHEAG